MPPSTTTGLRSASFEALWTVPLSRPSSSRMSASTSGTSTAVSARMVRSEPKPTPRSRTRAGIALQHVERRARAVAAEEVAADRRRQQGAAGHPDLVRAARRREDPEIGLGRALGRARRTAHDGDLVDDQLAAAQQRPEAVRADGEGRR